MEVGEGIGSFLSVSVFSAFSVTDWRMSSGDPNRSKPSLSGRLESLVSILVGLCWETITPSLAG